jgi:hypothetical protein
MEVNFSEAVRALGGEAALMRIANAARPPGDYLFNTLLPERNDVSYHIESGTMKIIATMAGLAAMDSPYPPVGLIQAETFNEQTAKIGASVNLSEAAIRKIQDHLMRMQISGGNRLEFIQNEILNFNQKLLLQPHFDTTEWLRGQALVNGSLDWTFGNKRLLVNYGIPTANILAKRTGTDAWDSSASKFWADIVLLRRALKGNVRAFIAHQETIDAIRYNPANNISVPVDTIGTDGVVEFRRLIGTELKTFSVDSNDRVVMIAYSKEGEIYDLTNPGQTIKIPFMPRKKILAIANNAGTPYIVGAGGTQPIEHALGYTHIAPTVEGNGTPGRWSRVYTPEGRPWSLQGESAANLLPVIEAPEKIAVAFSEIGGS